jgi:hypothetical protein
MPLLTIPEEHRSGIEALSRLTPSQIDELLDALRRSPVKFYREDLAEGMRAAVRSISPDDTEAIVDLLGSLEFVRANAEASLDLFTSDLADALARERFPLEAVDGSSVIARIRQLLEIPSIGIPAKARTLLLEGRTLCRARLLTDIRPVFDSSEAPSKPEGALIVHNLRLSYHDGSEKGIKDFIVTLDSNDLDELQAILQRGKVKEQALEVMLAGSGTPYLKIE